MLSDGQSSFCELVCKSHKLYKCPECFESAVTEALRKKRNKKPYPNSDKYPVGKHIKIL